MEQVNGFNFKRILFLLSVVFLVPGMLFWILQNVLCQNNGFKYFKNYSTKEYNRSPQNWWILQDQRGIIYTANSGGVLEFDGVSWRVIIIPNSVMRSMVIDQAGTIYIGGEGEGSAHLAPDEIAHRPASQTRPPTDSKISEKITAIESVIEKEEKETEPENKTDETNIILVVEDSADMRAYIRGALEPGYTIVDAKDGREGIQKAREIIPDIIISDIMMPEVDGYELCSVLKNDVKTSHIPIILLTAKASEENILQGLETGADDYITKPFSTKILIARIKNLIEIRSQLQKNINREMTLQPVKTSVSKIDQAFFHDLHGVINKNLSDEEFNVEQLCKKLYMGRTTLYRKVLALTGETPTDFIRSYRLKRGAELLKQNFGTVLEVAFEVGFSNSSYFAKCFKEKFHQLPSTYQASESE